MFEFMETSDRKNQKEGWMLKTTRYPYRIKDRERVKKKQSLIAAKSSKLFIEKGFHQTSLRDISRSTGMTMGNLYQYISKKEDILNLVLALTHQRAEDLLYKDEIFDEDDPQQSLRRFVKCFMDNKNHISSEMVMSFCESRFLPEECLKQTRIKEIRGIQKLEQIICAGVQRGIFNTKDPFFAASMIIYQLITFTISNWLFEQKYSEKEVHEMLEDHILKTIIV